MGRLSWGGGKLGESGEGHIGAKSWIFETELGPIPVTRYPPPCSDTPV